MISQSDNFQINSGSNAALFLGFDVDRAWLPLDTHGFRHFNLNTYFDARLTSVATQAGGTTTSNAGGNGTAAGTQPSTVDSFKTSNKAASLQTGIYVPFETTRWGHGRYSLFAGPLGKAGFVTLTDQPAASSMTETQTSGQNAGTATAVAIPITGRFYTSYAWGTRLGVYRHFMSRDAAPDLVSYVDIAAGRFGNFEAFRQVTAAERLLNYGLTNEFIRVRPWRWSFEGLLKIPRSPFVVGFNANIGLSHVPAQTIKSATDQTAKNANGMDVLIPKGTDLLIPFAQPKDDLRFLFGARFDASKLMRLLPSLQ